MKKTLFALAFCAFGSLANAQHTVIMKDGSKLNGELQSIQNNTVTFFYKGSNITFNVGEISSIQFDGAVGGASSVNTTTTKGATYVMPGRKLTRQPKIDNLTMEKGIVVVNITIDKYGNVLKSEPGADGTTTTSTYLLTKADQAAKSAMFDGGTTFPLQQKGTITITF
jgi:hypothetical protein